jgi:Concanavalin A-like lectin/glucanases superfamily
MGSMIARGALASRRARRSGARRAFIGGPPAGIHDATRLRLYATGKERRAAKTGTISASFRPILVGGNGNTADAPADGETLHGRVDDVRLYSRALSANEIGALVIGS